MPEVLIRRFPAASLLYAYWLEKCQRAPYPNRTGIRCLEGTCVTFTLMVQILDTLIISCYLKWRKAYLLYVSIVWRPARGSNPDNPVKGNNGFRAYADYIFTRTGAWRFVTGNFALKLLLTDSRYTFHYKVAWHGIGNCFPR